MFAQEKRKRSEFMTGQLVGFEIEWRDQNQFVFHKALHMHTPIARRAFYQSERNFVFEQKPHNLSGVAALQRDLHARVLVKEGSEQPRENILRDGGGCSQG